MSKATGDGNTRRALIVDDSVYARSTLKSILEDAKYDVVGEAKDGSEAVKLYAELKPDIVTMDLEMPRVNGLEAIARIIELDKNARIVVISSLSDDRTVKRALDAGALNFSPKPIDAEEVMNTIKATFTKRKT